MKKRNPKNKPRTHRKTFAERLSDNLTEAKIGNVELNIDFDPPFYHGGDGDNWISMTVGDVEICISFDRKAQKIDGIQVCKGDQESGKHKMIVNSFTK